MEQKKRAHIEIGSVENNAFHCLFVKDNGNGIEEKHHDRIFKVFQTLQENNDIKNKGIGLSIVKKIIQTNGGKIYIDRESKNGAKFVIELPK